uniref:Uncharacterized mitochondrial protein AtMg00810-like n=1 Tax=Tanacetum cinerariifolium TaxID=118510 RepID=A0A6L2MET0_TANCI|nr:uncharacterized mitochondrial protein AtMg00810-like [Tanacetum cinerariifolium]
MTILNTLDPLGKFDGKVDEGFLVGYSVKKTMNYQPVTAGNQSNPSAGVQEQFDAEKAREESEKPEIEGRKPEFEVYVSPSSSAQTKKHNDKTNREAKGKSPVESSTGYIILSAEFEDFSDNNINEVNAANTPVLAVGQISTNSTNTSSAAELEDITYSDDEEAVGAEADFTNLETTITVSPIPTTRVHKDNLVTQIIGDLSSATQTRSMTKVHQALKDPSWIEAMQEELLQFKMQKDEGIDYKEVFTPVAMIEAIRLFLAYASFMGFMVYQMDVKSAFLYGTIIFRPSIFPRDLCKAFEKLMKDKFQMSLMGELTFFLGLQVKQKPDWIFISQDKYVVEILRTFGLTDEKSVSTPIDTEKPLLINSDGEDVDVHTYRPMIGSLMYLTSSRPDIMFAVCACARFQVAPKAPHLHAVKRIFRYLKGEPHLGLWYPKDSSFNLVAYLDSDYAGTSLDRKSTTGGCQFLRCRLISWQCKKQTVVATLSTEAEYVVAASCCAQVLWILAQLLDYGSSMALAVICLSTGRKFNFSKAKVGDLSSHSTKYSSPVLTQKVFANMRRVGNRFSRLDTPFFEGKIVAQQDDAAADEGAASVAVDDVPATVDEPSIPSPTPTTQPPPPSQDLPFTSQVQPTTPPSPIAQPPSPQQQLQPSHDAEISMDFLHTLLETWGIIANINADGDVTLKDVAAIEKTAEIEVNTDVQGRKAESQAQIYQINLEHADKDDMIDQVQRKEKEDNVMMRYQTLKRKPQTESQARKNMMIYLRNMAGFKMDYFKRMRYDDIRPIFEKKKNSNVAFLKNTKEHMEEKDSKAQKRASESQAEKEAKKQKLGEEVEELKRHL